jgi:hypothetical protein
MNGRQWHLAAVVAIVLVALLLGGRPGRAHKPITSPFTYNEDVFPIVRDRCGQCHLPGGIAPMSLMTYKDAYPWGESIRTELIAGHMPPWSVDGGHGNIRNARTLTARELNILLTWASGGNPVGNADHTPPPVALAHDWRLGMPDLVLPLPSEFTLPPGTTETTAEFALPTATKEARWVRAVDLLPGNPAVVRSATVTIKSNAATGDGATDGLAPERVLAVWVPGEEPIPLRDGAAFRLPAGAELVVRVRYKKTWEYERVAMSDRSTVGLYFSSPPASEVRALTLQAEDASGRGRSDEVGKGRSSAFAEASADRRSLGGGRSDRPEDTASHLSFNHIMADDVQALALYPDPALGHTTVQVTAIRPDGSRVEMIRFRPQPDWVRRYWFEQPVALPRGSRIQVDATLGAPLLPPGSVPAESKPVDRDSVRLTLDVVSR